MKSKNKCKFLPIISSVVFALSVSSHAATVSWGTWLAVTNNTAILTPTGFTYAGANFNGSTTTINNGPGGTGGTDVIFTGIAQNASGSVGSPTSITVGTSGFNFASAGTGNSNVSSAVGSPQTWTTVLDRVIGDDGTVNATISLSGLANGTEYTVQFFSNAPDANILSTHTIISGATSPAFGSHSGGGTKSIVATFTADAASQLFTIGQSTEPTFSALVIGTAVPEPSTALLGALGLLGLLRRRRN